MKKSTLNIEKTPEDLWNRLAGAMASVETTPEKKKEWTEKFAIYFRRLEAGAGRDELLQVQMRAMN